MNRSEPDCGDSPTALDDDIVREFVVECNENLDQLDRDLVALEHDPASQPTLSSIFRTVHTIKGTCGFLGFAKLECVTHVGESLLSKLRDGELTLRPEITTALLSIVDAIREMLANIETLGAEGEADYAELLQTLMRMHGGPLEEVFASHSVNRLSQPAPESPQHAGQPSYAPETGSAHECSRAGGLVESTIRVDVGLLDTLMNQVGELALARNQLLQLTNTFGHAQLLPALQRLNLVTNELQTAIMKTRLQPIGSLWSKFPRVVRDLAVHCGKQVRLEMEGAETELDKTVVESIKDPLTHLLRNAVDHGIEPVESRRALGKPAEGCLRLRAFHAGGQIHIEISDDGGGLNLVRVRQKAIESGLLTSDQAQRMSDRDAALLIFTPGFSTASQVTHISGRGVGMDVVKTNIERIGGAIDIHSRTGQGTTVRLKIPLTLTIVPAIIISGGDPTSVRSVSISSPPDIHP